VSITKKWKDKEHTREMNGVSATKERAQKRALKKERKNKKAYKDRLGVTLTREEAKLCLQIERQQDSHAASLLLSLFCLKAYDSFVHGGTHTPLYPWWHLHTFVCMDIWMYGCMVLLALFLCFWGFFTHYVSVILAFAILPHECLLGCFTQHDTHTTQCGATCNVSQH
jgi:hypothetical protein